MFDIRDADIGLWGGETERLEDLEAREDSWRPPETLRIADSSPANRHVLPPDLEAIPPGPFLFAILSAVDRARLSGHDVIRLLQARERLSSHIQAEAMADIVEVAHCVDTDHERIYEASEFASADVAAALHLTRRAAENRVDFAVRLRERLPHVWELLSQGEIDPARARVLLDGTRHLDEDLARDVIDRLVDDAPGLTTGQLRARVSRLCLEADAEAARRAYEHRVEGRHFETGMTADGTANVLIIDAPPDRAAAASAHVDTLARSLKCVEGENRTMDQLRTDVALDLLCGRHLERSRQRAIVEIRVDATTLAELDDRAAEIPGMGPVIADIARQFARSHERGEWRYAVTRDGETVASGVTRRRPSTGQRRRVEAVNPTCVHPGCRMPSSRCDIDHTTAYSEGGATTECNLAPLCRHHHRVKHEAGWKLDRLAAGLYQWTSRLGHAYVTSGQSP